MRTDTVLIVDDEKPIVDLIAAYLQQDGFVVHIAHDGSSAIKAARAVKPALVVLDIMLPGIDGVELCRMLQKELDVYVLMLTARTDEADRLIGLSAGADDYLTKPFSPRELVLRVKAILRRRNHSIGKPIDEQPELRFESLVVNPEKHEVWLRGHKIDLTQREFQLLYALAQQPGRVFSRDQLLERVWGQDFAGIDRVVDVHIGLLRKKMEDDPANPTLIQTIRGVGYKLVARQAQRESQ
jgi:two-component system alkaline phosphatase synthesis response regulator PhoP